VLSIQYIRSVVISVTVLGLGMAYSMLTTLRKHACVCGLNVKVLKFYRMWQILFEVYALMTSNMICFFQSACVFVISAGSFAMIKLYGVLPWPMYISLIGVVVFATAGLHLFIPCISFPFESSLCIEQGRKQVLIMRGNRAVVKRMFNTTKHIKCESKIGTTKPFFNDRGVIMTISESIVNITLEFVLIDFNTLTF
jgi:hypothetical protein